MRSSTCTISRLNGARTIMNIIKRNVFMLIIGKTSVANHTFLATILLKSAKSGRQVILSVSMKKAALSRATVDVTTAGKSNFFTLFFTRLNFATMLRLSTQDRNYRNVDKTCLVDTIIALKINVRQLWAKLVQRVFNLLNK